MIDRGGHYAFGLITSEEDVRVPALLQQIDEGVLRMSVPTQTWRLYSVDRSDDLLKGEWETVDEDYPGDGQDYHLNDLMMDREQFYRIRARRAD